MKGLTIMKENYLQPVLVKDVQRHGDFAWSEPTITVVRVKFAKCLKQLPIAFCKDLKNFKAVSGYDFSAELYLRSHLMIFDDLSYTVEVVDWIQENEACRKAVEDNQNAQDFVMTFECDNNGHFEYSKDKHYEFTIPDEILLVLPVDLNESQYAMLEDDEVLFNKFVEHLAWRQLLSMLPITDIREVPNEPEDVEMTKLCEMETFVLETEDEMFKAVDGKYFTGEKYTISVELNGRKFELGCCAKEYEGLLDYIRYMKSEI